MEERMGDQWPMKDGQWPYHSMLHKGLTMPAAITIPFLGGRPERDISIIAEDEINLKIALETAGTLEEFLQLV